MAKTLLVIGAGVGGLSTAVHARAKGWDVTVVEKGRIGGKAAGIDIDGYRLDPGPSIIILKSIYERVFKSLGRNLDDYLQFERLDPITRVFFQGEQFDIPSNREEACKFVDSLSSSDGRSFRELLEKLDRVAPFIDHSVFAKPYEKPWQLADPNLVRFALPFDLRKTYRELVDGWFSHPLLKAFFYGFPSYGGQSYESKAAGALLIPYYMFSEGVFYPKGGVRAIPAAFRRLADELGVNFVQDTEIVGFDQRGSELASVTDQHGRRHSADRYAFNWDRVSVEKWFGRPVPEKPSYSYFTMHWGLPEVRTELKHHTLVVPNDFQSGFDDLYRDRAFPKKPIVYLNHTSAVDPDVAPAGKSNLFAVVTCPAKEEQLNWEGRLEEYADATLQTLAEAGIEIDRKSADFERIQSPLYFEAEHGNFKGTLYGADEQYRLFGLFPWSNRDSALKNVRYCGGAVQPGAGLPMVTLSGKFVAESL